MSLKSREFTHTQHCKCCMQYITERFSILIAFPQVPKAIYTVIAMDAVHNIWHSVHNKLF